MTPLWDQNNPLGMPLKSNYQTTCRIASTLVFAARENLLTSLSAGMHECIETCRHKYIVIDKVDKQWEAEIAANIQADYLYR